MDETKRDVEIAKHEVIFLREELDDVRHARAALTVRHLDLRDALARERNAAQHAALEHGVVRDERDALRADLDRIEESLFNEGCYSSPRELADLLARIEKLRLLADGGAIEWETNHKRLVTCASILGTTPSLVVAITRELVRSTDPETFKRRDPGVYSLENASYVYATSGFPISGACTPEQPWGQCTKWLPDGTPVDGRAFVAAVLDPSKRPAYEKARDAKHAKVGHFVKRNEKKTKIKRMVPRRPQSGPSETATAFADAKEAITKRALIHYVFDQITWRVGVRDGDGYCVTADELWAGLDGETGERLATISLVMDPASETWRILCPCGGYDQVGAIGIGFLKCGVCGRTEDVHAKRTDQPMLHVEASKLDELDAEEHRQEDATAAVDAISRSGS
jgi:hypothetical protein